MCLGLLALATPKVYAQVGGAAVKAGFGVDADVRADTTEQGTGAGLNTDDWFPTDTIAPAIPGTGIFVIDTTGGGAFRTLISGAATEVGRNKTFIAGMNPGIPTSNLDAIYVRDHHSSGSAKDTTVFVSAVKNADNLNTWALGIGGAPQKNDIIDAAGHLRRVNDSLWLFAYQTTNSADGNAHVDYEFFATDIQYDPVTFTLSGLGADSGHTAWQFDGLGNITQVGDVIMTVDFENGGTTPLTSVRLWVDTADTSGPNPFTWTGVSAAGVASGPFEYAEILVPAGAANAVVNTPDASGGNGTTLASPWGSLEGPGSDFEDSILTLQLTEIGINLTSLGLQGDGGGDPCVVPLGNILFKSRSSSSFTSGLKDFVGPYGFGIFREKPQCDITAPDTLCPGSTGNVACVVSTPGATYSWSIAGGTITAGQGTTCITFNADNNCSGFVDLTVIVTSSDGCPDTCFFPIPAGDTQAPTISCPPDVTIECSASTDPANTGSPTATDNCSSITYTYADVNNLAGCNGTGTITRTWTATDACGNTDNCVQTITVVDTQGPSITCPADVTIECSASTDPANTGSATGADACGAATVSYSDVANLTGCNGTGTITRTWTVTDGCGNSVSCDQIITIVDTQGPTIACPADVTVECSASTDPANTGSATGSDPCGAVTITYADVANLAGCNGTGTITRTWTATDACGNSSSCDQVITVVDTQGPSITCPADVTVECSASTDPANTGSATGNDVCGTATVSYSDVANLTGCNGTGTITRTWTVTDGCGNTASCDQIITVVDTQGPSITCPADVTVECNASIDPANTGSATGSDLCGAVTIAYADVANLTGCNGTGTITRTWTATDACGNTTSCNQIITVVDTQGPSITCPVDVTVECDASTDPANTGSATASDPCGAVTITHADVLNLTGCNGTGTITRTWTATDACGNTNSCNQIITVVDTQGPSITCPPDVTVECSASTDPASTGSATGSDPCGAVTITYADVANLAGCNGTGSITRTWTATDACGNSSSCDQIITIVDTQGPLITCPVDVTVECDASTDPANTGSATGSDPCGAVTITYADVPLLTGCNGTGSITRTWTATDACGNSNSCDQIITVVDTQGPSITCPVDVTVECNGSTDPANTGSATGADACGAVTITYADAPLLTGCNGTGTITRTWTATDACGNSSSCNQILTIVDTQGPSISCPVDVTVECNASTDPANTGSATGADACGAVTITYADAPLLTGCNGTGTITRTWTATDACGNSTSCNQIITVVDTQGPSITCPVDVTVECNASTDPANTGSATGSDACGAVTITYADVPVLTGCNGTGTITRTWTATDACGNSSSCDQIITVVDTQGPSLTCPVAVTIECDESIAPSNTGTATGSDACGPVTISYSDVPNLTGCNGTGTITRTWTATDACGNQATCDQIITVVDTQGPSITCPVDVTVECNASIDPANTGSATGSDPCGAVTITYVDVANLTGCNGTGTITRTWTATDACGNSSSCNQIITVVDTQGPPINCPVDVTVECNESTDPANTGSATGSDACGSVTITYADVPALTGCNGTGTITRTWTATDACGNSNSCDQIITVVDTQAPPITCPADVTVNCGESTDPANTGSATGSDPCGSVTISYSDTPNLTGCSGGGTITRTWTATDACGNSSSCDQLITIIDNAPPLITCPTFAITQFSCIDEVPACDANAASATDDCDPIVDIRCERSDNGGAGCAANPLVITDRYIASDDCGNEDTCEVIFTVIDDVAPTCSVPSDQTIVLCSEEQVCLPVSASDNCSAATTCTVISGPGSIINGEWCYSPLGDEIVTVTVECRDDCGNTCQASFTVTFDVNEAPTCDFTGGQVSPLCLPPLHVVTWSSIDPDGDALSCSNTNPNATLGDGTWQYVPSPGEHVVDTITCTDPCGASCSLIIDLTFPTPTPPICDLPSDTTIVLCDPAQICLPVTATGGATCTQTAGPGTIVEGQWCYTPAGSETVNVSVECVTLCDTCRGSFSVTFEIATPPTITCPSDEAYACVGDVPACDPNAATVAGGTAPVTVTCTASDNGGSGCANDPLVITYTYIATDACGKADTCAQTIMVVDDVAPTITGCPTGATFDCLGEVPAPCLGQPTATDNCDNNVTITCVRTENGGLGCIGNELIITDTYTATDDCGNSASCAVVYTVRDDTPPEIVCPPDLVIDYLDPVPPAATNLIAFTAQGGGVHDICGEVTITHIGDEMFGDCEGTEDFALVTRHYLATDVCGNIAECEQVIRRICPDTCVTYVSVGETPDGSTPAVIEALNGSQVVVPIWLSRVADDLGGLDLLLCYDQSALSLLAVEQGDAVADWEYFTYRTGVFGNCSGACPTGSLRIVAIANLDNGVAIPEEAYRPADGPIAFVTFYVTPDRNFINQCAQVGFCWYDCGDNTLSSRSGDTTYVEYGMIVDTCLSNPKGSPIAKICFIDGMICIIEPPDDRGDLNLNGFANEVGDAVLYTNYFIHGPAVFDPTWKEVQILASDVNDDGIVLTVADLIYLIRIITGDVAPFPPGTGTGSPKLAPNAHAVEVTYEIDHGMLSVRTQSTAELGGGLYVFRYSGLGLGEPQLTEATTGMQISYAARGGELRVLLTPGYDGFATVAAGSQELFRIPVTGGGSIALDEVQMSAGDGAVMSVQTAAARIPADYALHQNYPNPFNAGTVLPFDLKAESDWTVQIYNIAGQVVRSYTGHDAPGRVQLTWDGTDARGSRVASGIYFYRVTAGDFTAARKMTLIK